MTATPPKPAITTRQKIILGVLGMVLAVVLLFPSDKGTTSTTDAPEEPRRRKPAQDQAAQEASQLIRWPEFALAEVLGQNPFAKIPVPAPPVVVAETPPTEVTVVEPEPPAALPSESDEDDAMEQSREAARTLRVSLIIKGEKGPAALIGTRIVREGDIIEGCRILSISDAGVIVVPTTDDEDSEP
jgi:hypothetical protein